jgi:hypothetical protein
VRSAEAEWLGYAARIEQRLLNVPLQAKGRIPGMQVASVALVKTLTF